MVERLHLRLVDPERPIISGLTLNLSSQEAKYVWENVSHEYESSDEAEIIIAPRIPTYDPDVLREMLKELTFKLTDEHKPTVQHDTGMIGLGFKHGIVQFKEPEIEGKKAQYVTIRMVAHEGVVHTLADYRNRRIQDLIPHIPPLADLGFYIDPELIEKFKGKEHKLIEWAQEHIGHVLKRNEDNSPKS